MRIPDSVPPPPGGGQSDFWDDCTTKNVLDRLGKGDYNVRGKSLGPVAQLGAHHIRIVGVESSNLFRSTMSSQAIFGLRRLFLKLCNTRLIKHNEGKSIFFAYTRAFPYVAHIQSKSQGSLTWGPDGETRDHFGSELLIHFLSFTFSFQLARSVGAASGDFSCSRAVDPCCEFKINAQPFFLH